MLFGYTKTKLYIHTYIHADVTTVNKNWILRRAIHIYTFGRKNISKTKLGAVTDVSDQFVMLNIKGSKVFDLFATGSPFNFNEFKNKKGSVIQTILSHIDVIIHYTEINEVNLFVRRSFSQHLHSWMSDSASRL